MWHPSFACQNWVWRNSAKLWNIPFLFWNWYAKFSKKSPHLAIEGVLAEWFKVVAIPDKTIRSSNLEDDSLLKRIVKIWVTKVCNILRLYHWLPSSQFYKSNKFVIILEHRFKNSCRVCTLLWSWQRKGSTTSCSPQYQFVHVDEKRKIVSFKSFHVLSRVFVASVNNNLHFIVVVEIVATLLSIIFWAEKSVYHQF